MDSFTIVGVGDVQHGCASPLLVLSNVCSARCADPSLPYPETGQNAAKGTEGKSVSLVSNTLFSRWKKKEGGMKGP